MAKVASEKIAAWNVASNGLFDVSTTNVSHKIFEDYVK